MISMAGKLCIILDLCIGQGVNRISRAVWLPIIVAYKRQAEGFSTVTITAFVAPWIGPRPNRANMTCSTASVTSSRRAGFAASIAVRIVDP